jgi:putative ABC transport system permease protein
MEAVQMLADFRYAVRRWIARPAFTTTAVLTLALGIGAATAIFSVLEAVILRPLPWKEPDRLVTVWIVRPQWMQTPALAASANRGVLTWPNWREVQQQSQSFEAIGVWGLSTPILSGDLSEVTRGMFVSANFLLMLGVRSHLGRFFEPLEDEQPTDSVLVSYETWQRRFGSDPNVLGRRVVLDEQQKTIVGVLPPRFEFEGPAPEFVLPYGSQSAANRTPSNGAYRGVARLKPGVTLQDALRDVEPILRAGEKPEERTARLEPLADTQLGESRRPLWMLFSAAGLLLLIACTNVAGLLLGDAASRRHEVAVRTALGAGRRQLVRALFAESATLGIAGAILGVVAAALLAPVVVALAPATLPRIDSVSMNARVLIFSIGLTLVTTLSFGMGPALALSRARPAGALRERGAATLGRQRVQGLLVIVQVAFAFVLLVGATLFGQTFIRLSAAPTGFDSSNLVALTLRTPRVPGETAASQSERTRLLQERLAAVPGVISAAAAATIPFSGRYGTNNIEVDGERFAEPPSAARQVVTMDYLQTIRVRLVKGRYFSQQDSAEPVGLVSEEFERRYLRGNAIDRRFRFMGNVWYRVIGVVADAKQRTKADATGPTFYVLDKQVAAFSVSQFVLRTAGDPRVVFAAVREAVRTHDRRTIVLTVDTMSNLIRRSMAAEEFRSMLSGIFGGAALLLAVVGLYALLSRSVANRVHEIGVRMALGARPVDVLGLIASQGGVLVVLGLLVGMPASLIAARLISSLLYGVTATNVHAYALVAAAFTIVSFLAMGLPARRASRIDPMAALREP